MKKLNRCDYCGIPLKTVVYKCPECDTVVCPKCARGYSYECPQCEPPVLERKRVPKKRNK